MPRNLVANHFLSQQYIRSHERNRVYRLSESYLIEHLQPSLRYELCLHGPNQTSSAHNISQSVVYSTAIDQIDGRFLLCGNQQGIVTIYDLERSTAPTASVSSSGTPSSNGSKHILAPVRTITSPSKSILSSVQWFPRDTGLFLATSFTGRMTLFDTNAAAPLLDFPLDSNEHKAVYWSQFNPHPSQMTIALAAVENGTVRVCDILAGDCVHTFRCHQMATTSLDWNPVREYEFISASKDGTVKTWDIRRVGNVPLLSLDWAKDHSYHLTHSLAGKLPSYHAMEMRVDVTREVQSKKAELRTKIQLARAHESEVMSVRYSPCGKHLLTAGNDTKLRLWSAATGGLIAKDYAVGKKTTLPYRLEFITFPYTNLSSTATDYLFLFPNQQKISVLPLTSGSGNALFELTGHFGHAVTALYRPHKQQVISSAKDGMLLLWDHSQYQAQREADIDDDMRRKKRNASYHLPIQLTFSSSTPSVTSSRVMEDSAGYYSSQIAKSGAPTGRSTFILPIIRQYLEDARMINETDNSASVQSLQTPSSSSGSTSIHTSSAVVGETIHSNLTKPKLAKANIKWDQIDQLLDDDEEVTIPAVGSSFFSSSNQSHIRDNPETDRKEARQGGEQGKQEEKEKEKRTEKKKDPRGEIDKILGKRSRAKK